MSFIKSFFGGKEEPDLNIGVPHLVRHTIHVQVNPETGQLDGLPNEWKQLLEREFKKGKNISFILRLDN